jgi:hypothetical protein
MICVWRGPSSNGSALQNREKWWTSLGCRVSKMPQKLTICIGSACWADYRPMQSSFCPIFLRNVHQMFATMQSWFGPRFWGMFTRCSQWCRVHLVPYCEECFLGVIVNWVQFSELHGQFAKLVIRARFELAIEGQLWTYHIHYMMSHLLLQSCVRT